jgi:23S rRNA (uridine2552-2'-O)-methyltransferase
MQGQGRVIAVDLLEMVPLRGVTFVRGDFREQEVLDILGNLLAGLKKSGLFFPTCRPIYLGLGLRPGPRHALAELALEFARNWLKPDGAFLVKVFQGHHFADFLSEMRKNFKLVSARKPDASRDRSPEVYLLGRILKA